MNMMMKKLYTGVMTFVLTLFIFTCPAKSAAPNDEQILEELEFKGAALIDAVRIISELSDVNIVITPGAKEVEVTVFLRHVSVKHAIETICRVNNLWYRKEDLTETYRIMTNEEYAQDLVIHRDEETKVFNLNNLNVNLAADAIGNLYGERVKRSNSGEQFSTGRGIEGQSDGEGTSSSKNTISGELSIDQLSSLKTNGLGNNVISASQVQQLFDQQEPIYVTVAEEHNLVLIRTGDRRALEQIGKLIKELDRPVPQVLLEMKILDVLVDDNFSSVFNFDINGVSIQGKSQAPILIGNNPLTNSGSFIFEYMNNYLKANIELLQKNKKVNVLSTPMILASNNRPSKLFVGEEQLLVKGYESSETTTTTNGITASSSGIIPLTEIEEVGNSIEITPFINMLDGSITLNIKQENSSIRQAGAHVSLVNAQGEIKVLSIDTINTARLEGTIIVKDNHTIAVGGLIRETISDDQTKVPFLSDIPFLGNLFKSISDKKQRSELILLITPRLLTSPEEGEFNKNNLSREGKQLSLEDLALQCVLLCR